ncbi:MAG: tetratricopeptide repeat protein [Oscillospiraceae bacterium]|nr:tetratricopeptide repeat protein [Oscillospiraceae bacterium]
MRVIRVGIASSEETKGTRDFLEQQIHRKSDKVFEPFNTRIVPVMWESERSDMPQSGRSQDRYNEKLSTCDLVAFIIKNWVRQYTKEEFDKITDLRKRKGKPLVVVYAFKEHDDDDSRHAFIKSLREGDLDYFHLSIARNEELWINLNELIDELLFGNSQKATEYQNAIASVEEAPVTGERATKAKELFEQGKITEAQELLDEAAIAKEVADTQEVLRALADEYKLKAKIALTYVDDLGRFAEAEKYYELAIDAWRSAKNLFAYAHYLHEQNNLPSAEPLYNEALAIYRRLTKENPVIYEPDAALVLNSLGVLHSKNNNNRAAEEAFTEALAIFRRLAEENRAAHEPNVARMLNNLGLFRHNNNIKAAEAAHTEALAIRRRLAAQDPSAYELDLAQTLESLALLYQHNNDYETAKKKYTEALTIYRRLVAQNPATYNTEVARALYNLGNLHGNNHNSKAAEEAYTESLAIFERYAKINPKRFSPDVERVKRNLANLRKK